jgi:choline dehydrogenase
MMEAAGGASIIDVRAHNGRRKFVFQSSAFPWIDRLNLTVLAGAVVLRLMFSENRAIGVDISHEGKTVRLTAGSGVMMSLGAADTPKVLMQSGIGDDVELRRLGIPVGEHLPGMGQSFQDHPGLDCAWEYPEKFPPRNVRAKATYFRKRPVMLKFRRRAVRIPLRSGCRRIGGRCSGAWSVRKIVDVFVCSDPTP